jgi:diaminohydroxyphosphoribosylaminopyrimidine deaminase/5-amino-6-(5-phosphoribosylamino)uracil reductase
MDAIIVGVGTALADNPHLTARPSGPRVAARVILDSRLRLPEQCNLVQTASAVPVFVATLDNASEDRARTLEAAGCEIMRVRSTEGRPAIDAVLETLGSQRMTNVLVEGGAQVLGAFFDAGAVDEVHAFIAPRLIGGSAALSPIAGNGIGQLADSFELDGWHSSMMGDDLLVEGRIQQVKSKK